MNSLIIFFSAIISIYDADTFTINLPCNMPVVCKSVPIRAEGYDAPEIRGKCEEEKALAQEAKAYVTETLKKSKKIELRDLVRDKYFRLRAKVYVDGQALDRLIIDKELARAYHGGTRRGWCG